jgi:hypothetical protein
LGSPFGLLTSSELDAGFVFLPGRWGLYKVRATEGSSVALFHCTLGFKDQSKTVGVARQQLHFLCSDKENEAKESLALR